jgi:hypothetical protein
VVLMIDWNRRTEVPCPVLLQRSNTPISQSAYSHLLPGKHFKKLLVEPGAVPVDAQIEPACALDDPAELGPDPAEDSQSGEQWRHP